MEIESTNNSLYLKQMNFSVDISKLQQQSEEKKQQKQTLTQRTFEIIKVTSLTDCEVSCLSDLSFYEQPQIVLTDEEMNYYNQLDSTQNVILTTNLTNETIQNNEINQSDIQISNSNDQMMCFIQPNTNQIQLFDDLIIRTYNFCMQYQYIQFQVSDDSLLIINCQNNQSLTFKFIDEIDTFLQFPKPLENSLFFIY